MYSISPSAIILNHWCLALGKILGWQVKCLWKQCLWRLIIKQNGPADVCLFDLILYVPSHVCSGLHTKQGLMCLAQGHNAVSPVRLEPATLGSRVKHSTTVLHKHKIILFVCFCCFTSQVNSYGHCGTVSSLNHTFSWAGLNKRLTSNLCTYFRL